jgi:hypothetical protein
VSTLNEIMSAVRTERLYSPLPQQPKLHVVLGAVIKHTQNLYNELSNSNKAWSVREVEMPVNPDQQDALVPVDAQIGKILSVVTYDPSRPQHEERSIDFFEIQNLNFQWNLPNDVALAWANWDGSPHTADRMAFYFKDDGDNSGLYARIKPIPKLLAIYKVMYAVGDWASGASLSTSPILANHHQLIEIRAARTCLPDTSWHDDDVRDAAKRIEVRQTLNDDEDIVGPVWRDYIRSLKQGRMRFRRSAISF